MYYQLERALWRHSRLSFSQFRLLCESFSLIQKANDETGAVTATVAALKAIGFELLLLSLYDPRTQKIRVEKICGDSWNRHLEATEENLVENSILSAVLTTNKAKYIRNPGQISSLGKQLRAGSGIVGQYVLPIRLKDEMIGTLQINLAEQDGVTKDEELILETISTHLAVSISRLRGIKRSTELTDHFMTSSRLIATETLLTSALHNFRHRIADMKYELDRTLMEIREHRTLIVQLSDWRKTVLAAEQELEQTVKFISRFEDDIPEVIDLHRQLLYSRDVWRSLFQQNRVMVHLKLEATNSLSKIHTEAFHEIVSVLFVNSVQAHAKRINVRTYNSKNSLVFSANHIKKAFCLEIMDDGVGLVADRHEEVFKPSYSTKPNALGLGLFIARSLARDAGGDLAVVGSGVAQRGVTFRLALPYAHNNTS
jgi:signal transduction histidine kinase